MKQLVQPLFWKLSSSLLKLIADNAGGKSGDFVAETVIQNALENETFGYNAVTEEFGDLYEMGIIDL